jgi:hypothetical protein
MTARQPPRRARVRQILREIARIGEAGYALPGSVVIRSTACGKPVCRCKADPPELHGPYVSWIRRSDGKPVTRKLTPGQEQRTGPGSTTPAACANSSPNWRTCPWRPSSRPKAPGNSENHDPAWRQPTAAHVRITGLEHPAVLQLNPGID